VVDELVLLGTRGGDAGGIPSGAAEYDRPAGPVSAPRSAPRQQPAAAPPEDFQQGVTDDDVPF
jgi:hypothetical protein